MAPVDRRKFLEISIGCGLFTTRVAGVSTVLMAGGVPTYAQSTTSIKDRWISAAIGTLLHLKDVEGRLILGRFNDPVFYLTESIAWTPKPGQSGNFKKVEAPKGFVSDLASIPSIFWSILRPDGNYAFAAILHDYLYWEQTESRNRADDILKIAMQELKVPTWKVWAIYNGVRLGGLRAWHGNARLKAQGEKRVLVKYPPNAVVTWEDWKKQPDVFAP